METRTPIALTLILMMLALPAASAGPADCVASMGACLDGIAPRAEPSRLLPPVLDPAEEMPAEATAPAEVAAPEETPSEQAPPAPFEASGAEAAPPTQGPGAVPQETAGAAPPAASDPAATSSSAAAAAGPQPLIERQTLGVMLGIATVALLFAGIVVIGVSEARARARERHHPATMRDVAVASAMQADLDRELARVRAARAH